MNTEENITAKKYTHKMNIYVQYISLVVNIWDLGYVPDNDCLHVLSFWIDLTVWSRSSCEWYKEIQFLPQSKYNAFPLQKYVNTV
jgi:hypothetical protein